MNKQLELFTSLGIELVPIVPGTKKPPGQWGTRKFTERDFEGNEYAIKLTDNWCVLDVEGPSKTTNGMPFFENMIAGHHEFPETIMWSSPSGGIGALFRCKDLTHVSLAHEIGVELRTGLKVHKIPPSAGYELLCDVDDVPFVPEFLVELMQSYARPQIERNPATQDEYRYETIKSALEAIPPAEDYQTWCRIGMALKTADFDAFELWESWSKRAKNSACNHREKWDGLGKITSLSLGSLFHEAKSHGWQPKIEDVELPHWCPVVINDAEIPQELASEKTELRQIVLPEPDGALKEIRDVIFAEIPQPQYSLGAALCVMTAIFQRKARMIGEQQNIYATFIGESGSQKTRTQRLVQKIIETCNIADVMSDPRSTAALKKSLSASPNQVLFIDEWGQELLHNIYVRNPATQYREKLDNLLKLHGAPHRLQGHGTAQDSVGHIEKPRLSLCATGTLRDFSELCRKSDFVTTGLLSRLVVFFGNPLPKTFFEDSGHSYEIPWELLDTIDRLKCNASNPLFGHGARNCVHAMQQQDWFPLSETYPHLNSLIDRMFYSGLQFSSLHALGCRKETLDERDVRYGLNTALALLNQTITVFGLAAEDDQEKAVRVAIEYIKANPGRAWRDVYRAHRILAKLTLPEKKQILTAILDSGKVAKCSKTQKLFII